MRKGIRRRGQSNPVGVTCFKFAILTEYVLALPNLLTKHATMNFSKEPPPDDRELEVLEMQARYEYATRVLGISTSARSIVRILISQPGGWSISALSVYSGLSRNAVRNVLRRNEKLFVVESRDGAYFVTDHGRGLVMRLHRETLSICAGERAGYSPKLLLWFRSANAKKPSSDAAKVQFSKKNLNLLGI